MITDIFAIAINSPLLLALLLLIEFRHQQKQQKDAVRLLKYLQAFIILPSKLEKASRP